MNNYALTYLKSLWVFLILTNFVKEMDISAQYVVFMCISNKCDRKHVVRYNVLNLANYFY